MDTLLTLLRAELTTPRTLSTRLAGAIATRMGVDDPLRWLDGNTLENLSEFEVEILLSPLFTPTREERARLEAGLPDEGIPESQRAEVAQALAGLACPVAFGGDQAVLPLHPVLLERYLRLLHLEGRVPPVVAAELSSHLPAADLPAARALIRSPVWQNPAAQALLAQVLAPSFTLEMLTFLTDFVRTYHPGDLGELVRRLRNLLTAYHQDSDHPVFNEQLAHYQAVAIASDQCNDQAKARQLAGVHAWLAALAG